MWEHGHIIIMRRRRKKWREEDDDDDELEYDEEEEGKEDEDRDDGENNDLEEEEKDDNNVFSVACALAHLHTAKFQSKVWDRSNRRSLDLWFNRQMHWMLVLL